MNSTSPDLIISIFRVETVSLLRRQQQFIITVLLEQRSIQKLIFGKLKHSVNVKRNEIASDYLSLRYRTSLVDYRYTVADRPAGFSTGLTSYANKVSCPFRKYL